MLEVISYFTESIDLSNHPIKFEKPQLKSKYYSILCYITDFVLNEAYIHYIQAGNDGTRFIQIRSYILARLAVYKQQLSIKTTDDTWREKNFAFIKYRIRVLKEIYQYSLLDDVALILFEELFVREALALLKDALTIKKDAFSKFSLSLLGSKRIRPYCRFIPVLRLTEQYQKNCVFTSPAMRKIVVTANMSAGKSTFINALIGKQLAKTSQQACTGNICYFYNKPFEDHTVSLKTSSLHLNATLEEIKGYDWEGPISMAAYFSGTLPSNTPFCIIDTPGVNASQHQEHLEITKNEIEKGDYDLLIYLLNMTQLGTTDDGAYLEYIAKTVDHEKIVFVLNKVDNLITEDESLDHIIQNQIAFLNTKGFEEPLILPVSSKTAFLAKKGLQQPLNRIEHRTLSADQDKFETIDLASYYEQVLGYQLTNVREDETHILLRNCGFTYVEHFLALLTNGGNHHDTSLR